MRNQCGQCGLNPNQTSARYRYPAAFCQICDEWRCIDCLRDDAIETGLISEPVANALHAEFEAGAFLRHCEATGVTMCPRCFEDIEEDESSEQEEPVAHATQS